MHILRALAGDFRPAHLKVLTRFKERRHGPFVALLVASRRVAKIIRIMTNTLVVSNTSLSWVHFGDLHIRNADEENYPDFLRLIEEANEHLAGKIDFAFLPGDNADDGLEAQYELVREALDRLNVPVHSITGDHDRKTGTLDAFKQYLEPDLYRKIDLQGFRLLFLNAMDGRTAKDFDFSSEQIAWLEEQLVDSRSRRLRPLVFTHLYPSELLTRANAFCRLIRDFEIELVEMGHTHYNELANDSTTIYAATRSTGQIEEGAPGFSLTTIDGDVVSWKFKERGPWPFVIITSPADQKLITRPKSANHVVRGIVSVRAKVWGNVPTKSLTCSIDKASERPMQAAGDCWEFHWDSSEVPDGPHRILVRAKAFGSQEAHDEIVTLVSQSGQYKASTRSPVDYENAIGAYPLKGILGTELGPNEKGTKGPWPSWRGR
jgi:3',5'-cyclic-AMP phosphodiesterase